MENKLDILSESLDKKLQVLRKIQEYNEQQEQAFKSERADLDSFDAAIEEKGKLIDELMALDDGFEAFYDGMSKELNDQREQYADRIRGIQAQIRQVTELSASIQAQEARNKKLVEEYFAKARRGLKESRVSSKAAYGYYQSMSGNSAGQSRFLDSKQ